MNPDLLNLDERIAIIKDIKSDENIERKREAFIRYEIYNDRLSKYVYKYLEDQFGKESAKMMPLISCVNTARKVIAEEAEIYSDAPLRTLKETSDEDNQILLKIYEDGRFNAKMQKANSSFKLNKGQAFVQPILQDRKIELRVLWAHQVDVIPDAANPEKAYAFITSSFDRSKEVLSDGYNQKVADADDAQALRERYTVWTKDLNFIMDGKGNILADAMGAVEVRNEIELLPFVDIASDKDGEFFVRPGESDTDFAIAYNGALSDHFNIVRRQGYAQAVFKGNPDIIPKVINLGPNTCILLPTDPNNPADNSDFKFVTPSPDIEGSIKSLILLVSNYLTSRGIDPKSIASSSDTSTNYSSALERLLAMMDKFRATKEDFDLFNQAEQKIFEIVRAWAVKYTGTEYLDEKYHLSASAENAEMSVQFATPSSVKTETEELADCKAENELGIGDRITACMRIHGMTEEDAEIYLDKLDARKATYGAPVPEPAFGGGFGSKFGKKPEDGEKPAGEEVDPEADPKEAEPKDKGKKPVFGKKAKKE